MDHIVLVGDLAEGVAIHGPFAEVLPLRDHAGRAEGGNPHVLVAGTFAGGFRVYGPFASFEDAEHNSGGFDDYVVMLPLRGVQ